MNDPRYVKWVDSYVAYEGGTYTPLNAYNLHQCTQQDYEKFYEPEKQASDQVTRLIAAGAFYCLDAD